MYKIFTLAVAVSVLPLSKKARFTEPSASELAGAMFSFQQTTLPAFFESAKAEPWSQNWAAAAQENIRKREYHFNWEEKLRAYSTPNRKNNLRFYYDDKGFSVQPRATKIQLGEIDPLAAPHEIKYKYLPNWKIRFHLNNRQVGKGFWKVAENKAEYVTDKITVQYINNDEGMRQNFIVHKPLSKDAALQVDLHIKTKLMSRLSGNQLQFFHRKNNVLNYQDLKVWDAAGRLLPASIKKRNKKNYYIQVETKDAVYPVTVDPISTTPAASIENNQANALLGYSVKSTGDVNGDGYSDVIVGAPYYDNGQTDEGAAFMYHGSVTGTSTSAASMVESNQANAIMGRTVAGAGDVNGDGYSDVIVGAYAYDNGQTDEGRAFVYHGSATGINSTAAATVENNQAFSRMGISVASAGDVNGDGYSDVLVGSHFYDNGQSDEGAVFVFHGTATGINTAAAAMMESNQASVLMGFCLASAGDVNGDGYSDVIAGAFYYDNGQVDEGAAFVYLGSAAGINTTASAMVESNQVNAQLGYFVGSAGDVNGDGYSDVVAGALYYDNGQADEGGAFVYHGGATGINITPAATVQSNQDNALMGYSVATVGDVNGDGYSDLVVGSPYYDNGQADEGAAFIYHGSGTGINTTAAATIESNQASALIGFAVASAGDVNGDGYSDLVLGSAYYDGGQTDEGAAFVYHGAASGINTSPASSVESNQAGGNLGVSVAGAGDVNGDGYGDVIMGAFYYDNGQADEGAAFVYHGTATGINSSAAAILESNQASAYMGRAVAGAGDVNGDGYSDVIVGASYYDNGQTDEGRVYVFHGSGTGINTTAAAIVESNQATANLGVSVAGAGDVNGDGYSDVIAGALFYDNGQTDEGRVYVYHGGATGINTTAAAMVESNQANAYCGISVAGAGDVNGDGYSDVIAGAWLYDNGQTDEGAAFVFHGSSTGINTTAAAIIESNQVNAQMGFSVAGAGDVNGDGYSDVIGGAGYYDNGQTDEGAAFVYHGSPAGINTVAAAMVEGNQAFAYLGRGVGGAGDVNGDGYSDVMVSAWFYDNGQTDEGTAFIYHGTATGISTTAAAIVESNQANAQMGFSVASAGDVNGDGYSDVIAGAHFYDNGQSDEGAAFIYHGNSPGTNKRNNLRLYNTDLTTPINSSNYLFSNFGAGLYAKSFLGRSKGKLVWETRLNYNAYSGTPITNSTFYTSQQSSYTDLGLAGTELKNIIQKISGGRYTRLRARIKYDPVTAITGQVYSPWRNVSSIIDANYLGVLPIELISFNAAWLQKGKIARLDFVTDKEGGICCFEIERSADGFNFSSIGSVAAKNSSGRQSYTFIDGHATGNRQFYRLKIKGIAGQVEYSNIQQLQSNHSTEILVFPNPATDVLQLQLNNPFNKMDVRILNSAGRVVKQMIYPASNQSLTIPVRELAAGKYWIQLQGGTEKQLLQFIKQ